MRSSHAHGTASAHPCIMPFPALLHSVADFVYVCESNACGAFLRECFALKKEVFVCISLSN